MDRRRQWRQARAVGRLSAALLHFNLGVACEELGQNTLALRCHEACMQLDPTQADAHYNAARLHQQLGHAPQAIRHYSEYRRLNP